jgi:hypothetical protein
VRFLERATARRRVGFARLVAGLCRRFAVLVFRLRLREDFKAALWRAVPKNLICFALSFLRPAIFRPFPRPLAGF